MLTKIIFKIFIIIIIFTGLFGNYSLAVLTPSIEDKPLKYEDINKSLKNKSRNIVLPPYKGFINKTSLTNPVFRQEVNVKN